MILYPYDVDSTFKASGETVVQQMNRLARCTMKTILVRNIFDGKPVKDLFGPNLFLVFVCTF